VGRSPECYVPTEARRWDRADLSPADREEDAVGIDALTSARGKVVGSHILPLDRIYAGTLVLFRERGVVQRGRW